MTSGEVLKSKHGDWLLKPYEEKFRSLLLPFVPGFIQTYHLTLLTIVWSGLIVYTFHLGITNVAALYWVPFYVFLQYITDLLDGAVGRARNTGLVRWGYYMDHFLDFTFVTAIIAGYGLLLGFNIWLFAFYAIVCGLHVSTYLLVSAAENFRISFLRIGPTEGRIIFSILHTILVWYDVIFLRIIGPWLVFVSAFILVVLVVINQHYLWQKDILNLKK